MLGHHKAHSCRVHSCTFVLCFTHCAFRLLLESRMSTVVLCGFTALFDIFLGDKQTSNIKILSHTGLQTHLASKKPHVSNY